MPLLNSLFNFFCCCCKKKPEEREFDPANYRPIRDISSISIRSPTTPIDIPPNAMRYSRFQANLDLDERMPSPKITEDLFILDEIQNAQRLLDEAIQGAQPLMNTI